MFCEECGNKMPDGAKFCGICGYRMTESGANVNPVGSDASVTAADLKPVSATEMNSSKTGDTRCIFNNDDKTEKTEIINQEHSEPTEIIPSDKSDTPVSFDKQAGKGATVQIHNDTYGNTSVGNYSGHTKKLSNHNKRGFLITVIAVIICVAGIVVAFLLLNTPERRIDNYYNNAAKYLLEMNYEQAIVEFDKILEIDPMNVEAYLGKARAYYEMGDIDKAIEILEDGYQKTGDDRIWDYLQEILDKITRNNSDIIQTEPLDDTIDNTVDETVEVDDGLVDLLWTEIPVKSMWYMCYDHYIAEEGEYAGFIDEKGLFINDNRYSSISDFVGNEKDHYSAVTTKDGKKCIIDSNLEVVMEFPNAEQVSVINEAHPLFVEYNAEYAPGDSHSDEEYKYIKIYDNNGTLLYNWATGLAIDGSGRLEYIEDPYIPIECRTYDDCTDEYHEEHWLSELTTNAYLTIIDDDTGLAAIQFSVYTEFDFDLEAARAAAYADAKEEANGEWFMFGYNSYLHYHESMISYLISYENGKLRLIPDSEAVTGFFGVNYIDKTDEYTISGGVGPRMYEPIYLSKDGDVKNIYNHIYDDNGILYAYFITDQKGYIVRKNPDDAERTQAAICNIIWQENDDWLDKVIDSSMSWQEQDAAQKKAIMECYTIISDWYDNLNWSKGTVDCGYYLVSKSGKWGFISIDTGEEVVLADDASDFNNGYAVVTNNGKGHIVDKDFNIVSEEFDCTSASVTGKYFVVKQGEKTILLEVEE